MNLFDIFKSKKETTFPENDLERYLMEAASDLEAQKYFYQKLLWNELIVLTPSYLKWEGGEQQVKETAMVKLVSFDNGYIPVFSALNRVFDEKKQSKKISYIRIKGQDLFRMTKGSSFILNPYSAYSKELLPDEIEQLMNGTIYDQIDAHEAKRQHIEQFNRLYDLACEKQKDLILFGEYHINKPNSSDQAKLEESVQYFDQCLTLNDDHWPSMFLMAKALQRLERHKEAFALLEKAFVLNEENHTIPMEAALEAIHLEDLEKALYYSEASMQRKPHDITLMGNHAVNLMLAERDEEALALIEEALTLKPKDKGSENVKNLIKEVMAGTRKRPTMKEAVEG